MAKMTREQEIAMFANKNKNLASKALLQKFGKSDGTLDRSKINSKAVVKIIDMKKNFNSKEPKGEVQVVAELPPTENRGSQQQQLGIFNTVEQAQKFTDTKNFGGSGETRMKKEVLLQNRASVGIRAVAEIQHEGRPATLSIDTHHPRGKYLISVEQNGFRIDDKLGIENKQFDTFDDAKKFVEKRFDIMIKLDKKNSNDFQSWETNIRQTDHELPLDRKFWHLPENVRDKIKNGESIEEFLKRIGEIN